MIGSHTIPKFYLEQFAIPSGRRRKMGLIWVYEKGKPPDQRATKVQCRVNGYFGSVRPNGSLDESLETKLAELENECNDVLFCATSDLFDWSSTANRNRLAFYAALLFCRATQKRNLTVRSWEKSHQDLSDLMLDTQYLEDMADHYSKETQQSISLPTFARGCSAWPCELTLPA
jgi:hypothetical protein